MSKFSILEGNCIKWIWSKQKLICEEWIHLDAYQCVIMQSVSVFITLHLHTLSSVFLLLHCLDTVYFVAFKMCKEIITRPVLLHLQFGPCETDFKYFFLLHWVKKTTISAFTNSLKASFLVKRKQLLCQLLLPFLLVCYKYSYLHTLQKVWNSIQNHRDILKTSLW
jgi:hypothetical protein